MAAHDRQWPPRLRSALRARLAARDLEIPKGLMIQYGPKAGEALSREPWITIMHRPGPSETFSVHDMHLPFRGEDDILAVIDLAERHALAMLRRDARDDALLAGGHQPRRPPLHMTEATPLVALAMALLDAGMAGIDGDMYVEGGVLHIANATLTTPNGQLQFKRSRELLLPAREQWPDTVLTALCDRPLSAAISLPRCGRTDIDAAVARLTIDQAGRNMSTAIIRVNTAPLLPVTVGDEGDDRRWLAMEPTPVG